MSKLISLYRKILQLPLSLLVKSRAIPSDPISELGLKIENPVLYVLPYCSQTDLLILQKNCLNLGLPDPLEKNQLKDKQLSRFVFLESSSAIFKKKDTFKAQELFNKYLTLHQNNKDLDVQVIPVSVLWGRSPGKENAANLRFLSIFQRMIAMIWSGRDNFIRFSQAVSLRYMADSYVGDDKIANKLARVANIHFSKQRYSAMGPQLPNRQAMFNKLLQSDVICKVIEEEAEKSNQPKEKLQKEAEKIINEIAANVNHNSLRFADRVLSWLWNKLYQGITVKNGDRVRKLALEGHEIVYIPCHRSHMDYLLLSYLLYHEGLVPPHIASGINLNFWPAGPLFRSWGAFFLRRTFNGNRLYSTIFREYLAELFHRGYSVEYFIEGGRSRTGRLLNPKTGMMAMTLRAVRGTTRPISIVPVYIGYEHVLEVDTYAKELRGAKKEKENAGLVLRVIKKLRNLGQGFVNFGEPIQVNHFLNENYPNWKEDTNEKPQWLNGAVTNIADLVMVHINNAAAINAKNLIGTALLNSRQRSLSKEQLLEQVESYLQLLRNINYSQDITIPEDNAVQLLEHLTNLPRSGIILEKDSFGDIIRLDRQDAVLMTYYRNNIQHLFVLPSLIANIVLHHEAVSKDLVIQIVKQVYPFLKAELFVRFDEESLVTHLEKIIEEFTRQEIIQNKQDMLMISRQHIRTLQLYSAGIREQLQRYYISLSLLIEQNDIEHSNLEAKSCSIAQRLSVLHGINAPEFFDKALFSTFIKTLKNQGYFDQENKGNIKKAQSTVDLLEGLISTEVKLSIQGAMVKLEEKHKI